MRQSMTSSRVTADSMAVRTTWMSGKGATGAFGEKGPREVDGGELDRRFALAVAGAGDGPASCRARTEALDEAVLALRAPAPPALDAGVGTFAGGGGGPPCAGARAFVAAPLEGAAGVRGSSACALAPLVAGRPLGASGT